MIFLNRLSKNRFFECTEWVIIGSVFLFQAAYFWISPPNFLDEGIWLELTRTIARGQAPYIDFPSVYGPIYLRFLSAVVSILGGKLIHLRLVMGCVQGLVCFLLLRWSLRPLIGNLAAFLICLICAFSIAHPSLDATMFWGLRYYSAFFLITPLCLEMLGMTNLSTRHRYLIYLFWAPLFFYSGEAGIIAAPVLAVSLIFSWISSTNRLRAVAQPLSLGLLGLGIMALVLGREGWRYCQELLINAPVTYKDMGFAYPTLTLGTSHYYYPFVILVTSTLFAFFLDRKKSLALWGMSLALIPAIKVASSRSDEVHLSYAYPFVILSVFLIVHTGVNYFSKLNTRRIWTVGFSASLVFCLFIFFSTDSFINMRNNILAVSGIQNRSYNSLWGLWMSNENFSRLNESSNKLKALMTEKSDRLFVFPFQQILYSAFELNPLFIEPIQPCSLKVTHADCSREFNFTNPDFVLWVPEGALYAWAFDAYYASFEYPESFETLNEKFKTPVDLGSSGWKLYERRLASEIKPKFEYFMPKPQDLEECLPNQTRCPFLDSMTNNLRLTPASKLTCLKNTVDAQDAVRLSFGMQLARATIDAIGVNISWVCKDTGTPNCLCSRARARTNPEEPFTKWVWIGFADWSKDDISKLTFFGIKTK